PLAYLYSTCTQCGLSGSIIWVFTLHGGKILPLFIPTHSGEQYQLLARGHTPSSCGDPVSNTDTSFLFSIIAREISIPVEQWRSFLMRLGVSIPPNFFHAHSIYDELIKLFQRGELRLVKIFRLENL